jgi:tRNA-specific 2-thiouridylase
VRYFVDQHLEGRTPNPCIECNRRVRFSYLLQRAMSLGADYLATGHYARVRRNGDEYQLLQSADDDKDQSYVLHVLGQSELARVLFPVGDYTKDEIRRLAGQFGFPRVAGKSESMDLCFLADGDYRRFLRRQAPSPIMPGPIVNQAGQELGQHQGLTDYTIGQRKGLGLATGQPLFVLAKDLRRNALVVGGTDALGQSDLGLENVNWIAGHPPPAPAALDVKIRYRATPLPAEVTPLADDRATVRFAEPVRGATAGQAAVFYAGQRCLGGGIICDEGWT